MNVKNYIIVHNPQTPLQCIIRLGGVLINTLVIYEYTLGI